MWREYTTNKFIYSDIQIYMVTLLSIDSSIRKSVFTCEKQFETALQLTYYVLCIKIYQSYARNNCTYTIKES